MNARRQIVGSDPMPSKRGLLILAIGALFIFLFCAGLAGAQTPPPSQAAPSHAAEQMQACLDRELKKAPTATGAEIRQTCERLKQERDAKVAAFEQQNPKVAKKADKICGAHPSWVRAECVLIAANQVWVGMTKEQALEAWTAGWLRIGPRLINRTVTADGVYEQWVRSEPGPTPYSQIYNYLYFTNGILTSYQLGR